MDLYRDDVAQIFDIHFETVNLWRRYGILKGYRCGAGYSYDDQEVYSLMPLQFRRLTLARARTAEILTGVGAKELQRWALARVLPSYILPHSSPEQKTDERRYAIEDIKAALRAAPLLPSHARATPELIKERLGVNAQTFDRHVRIGAVKIRPSRRYGLIPPGELRSYGIYLFRQGFLAI
jgi:hypothetical protein